jgi:cob(I)alamin adenosyltransferase
MKKGYIQIYTGDGKGKTTAAIGLAVRAAGAGLRVYFAQFIKSRRCSEHKALERFSDLVTVEQFGTGFIRGNQADEKAIAAARRGFQAAASAILSGKYDLVVLDEMNIALHKKLVSLADLLLLLKQKPLKTEVVLTGRNAPPSLRKSADLITEMKLVRHYMNAGVAARKGIEC